MPLEGDVGRPITDAMMADLDDERRADMRRLVPHYTPDGAWSDAVGHDGADIPFDEPALAIIGMWLYGGGPNPPSP